MKEIPPTIMAVPISRRANIRLLDSHLRNPGERRLRIRADRTTNMGRLPTIGDTSDTGPLASAHIDNTMATGASISLKNIMAKVADLSFM